jgi:hypothetical protein
MYKRMSTRVRNAPLGADSMRRGRHTLAAPRPCALRLRLGPAQWGRSRLGIRVAAFPDVATKPCADSPERKFKRAKRILRQPSTQLPKSGIMSPEARFTTTRWRQRLAIGEPVMLTPDAPTQCARHPPKWGNYVAKNALRKATPRDKTQLRAFRSLTPDP